VRVTSTAEVPAIETRGLRKTYRSRRGRAVGVEGLDLVVPVGGVHGFLGPNGSGKTTTIRMLLGLVRADSGTARIFGEEVPRRLPDVVGRVGAIVESPKFFPAFSARKNLDLLAAAIGVAPGRVGEVLAEVGLAERAGDRYRGYSLGMKQRLAIAATLLKDPDLLIFDEPTNGLDPAGIREIRDTMRGLADRGKTVLVSSHILAEVEQVADTVSIIARGRLIASGGVAVQGLSMAVPLGGIHGFLGPNGSGKTTTIRMVLGLARADSGTAEVFGEPVPHRLPHVIDRVGAIVESPKFFPAFTARRNLELLAGAIGAPRHRVQEVLEATHLGDRGRDRYAGFSLGMKQRLAIAATLLKDPDLLIFDEPTNGLDPAGIREVRDTMRSLGAQGKTVLVSSHILAEVEQVADTVSIIGHGTLLAEGPVSEILGGTGTSQVRVGVASPERAEQVLRDAGFTAMRDGEHLVVGAEDPSSVTRALAGHGLYVSELVPVRPDLESAFLALTADEGLGSEADRHAGGDTTGGRA